MCIDETHLKHKLFLAYLFQLILMQLRHCCAFIYQISHQAYKQNSIKSADARFFG